ncbi:membrane-spanning 4-domains subfamily A member 8-like isoform X1 [Hydractinia symbiolongicarpus]|uniref:membrane-spanning 4-domains subfamily A member 8-like isoform X1 n=1 Tax=Hydractinia symbiolongicarpus TaxID=13093 RepID=UPI00254EA9FE|nr:membrane-spanning 4-domains subfamily A member 8-like isoform X1 [Hydractinia symbiolongicarpus]
MQSSTVVTSMPVQGGGQMVVPIRNSMNVPTTRALAITQIVIGILSFVFGIGAATGFDRGFFVNKTGPGIWGGIWIFVTGVIGVISTTRPKSSPLNGTHMAFCIVSVMVAFINGVMFAIGLSFYNECQGRKSSYFINDYQYCSENRNSGVAVYACLVLMMIVEFFVALVTVVYTCQSADACCSSSGQGMSFFLRLHASLP